MAKLYSITSKGLVEHSCIRQLLYTHATTTREILESVTELRVIQEDEIDWMEEEYKRQLGFLVEQLERVTCAVRENVERALAK